MNLANFRQIRLVMPLCICSLAAALWAPLSAEPLGRPLSAEGVVLVDPANGRYLLLQGLPIRPIDVMLPKSSIAVVDSGVNRDHPQFAGRVAEEVDFTGEGTKDEIGHGTVVALLAVSGLMTAQAASPRKDWLEPSIISLKVIERNGTIRKASLLAALAWIEGKNIDAVNLSLGFSGTYREHADICAAIGRIKRPFFVAAAGNSGPGVASYPAACKLDNLMSVGRSSSDGSPDPTSGKADIYVEGTAVMTPMAQLLLEEAMRLAREGNLTDSLTKLDESIADHPLPEAYNQKGLIFFHQRRFRDAEEAFRKALDLRRSFAEALLNLGLSLYLQNDPGRARPLIEEALELAPDNPRIRFNLALVLMDLGDYANALQQLDSVRQLNPQYKNLQETIAEIQRRQNQRKN